MISISIPACPGIYCFIYRSTGRCYVGMAKDLQIRFSQHIHGILSNRKKALYSAVRQHGMEEFDFEILEECLEDQLLNREVFYIQLLDAVENGYNSFYRSGDYARRPTRKHSPETRIKIGLAHRGTVHSCDQKLKQSISTKGVKRPWMSLVGLSLRGKPKPDGFGAKISAALKGVKKSPEFRAKMSMLRKGMPGHPIDEATREKIRIKATGRKLSEETKMKISLSRRGLR